MATRRNTTDVCGLHSPLRGRSDAAGRGARTTPYRHDDRILAAQAGGRSLARGRARFTRVPDYLCDPALSFPYRRKPAPREIPFADHVTVVRLLGGWSKNWKHGEVDEAS